MQFRTKITIPKGNNPIDYNSRIVSLGSCFAENMAEKLDYFKFQNTCNPFGIIFNPVSIEKMIYRTLNQIFYAEKDIFFHNERWHCFGVHSDLSCSDKKEFLENLNAVLRTSLIQLSQASHIIITYGTSWVYRNIESNTIVANCHKVPKKNFQKKFYRLKLLQNLFKTQLDIFK